MLEFISVSSSSFDPAGLVTKLNEKSAEGWSVVSIVSTGGDVTAFMSRDGGAPVSTPAPAAVATPEPVVEAAPTAAWSPDPAPVAEPAGWAVAPAPAAEPTTSWTPAPSYEPAPVAAPSYEPAPAAAPSYEPAPAAAPAVPAGWYADPAGRFELRYWDGGTWTEHVSRAGQQYTDPPVA
jgi:hypothetical protein